MGMEMKKAAHAFQRERLGGNKKRTRKKACRFCEQAFFVFRLSVMRFS